MLSSRFPKGQGDPRNKPLKEENYTFTKKYWLSSQTITSYVLIILGKMLVFSDPPFLNQ